MLEAPEALLIAEQLQENVKGKVITEVIAGYTPHKFTFFSEKADDYYRIFTGKKIGESVARGGMVEMDIEGELLVFTDGCNLTYLPAGSKLPRKHQLLVCLYDDSCLVVSVRMYGMILHFSKEVIEGRLSEYYQAAADKPQVMGDDFTESYFFGLIEAPGMRGKSVKAALATQQTIPGLGNGVLQDILYNAEIHPKRKLETLSEVQKRALYKSIKKTLQEMYEKGGRNVESDLLGHKGGYSLYLSKDTAGHPCPKCGYTILKENYLGGAIYYCPGCQKL